MSATVGGAGKAWAIQSGITLVMGRETLCSLATVVTRQVAGRVTGLASSYGIYETSCYEEKRKKILERYLLRLLTLFALS